jgi:hypothetical protein
MTHINTHPQANTKEADEQRAYQLEKARLVHMEKEVEKKQVCVCVVVCARARM